MARAIAVLVMFLCLLVFGCVRYVVLSPEQAARNDKLLQESLKREEDLRLQLEECIAHSEELEQCP